MALLGAWRKLCQLEWQGMKASPHYHGGKPCTQEETCPKYVRPGAPAVAAAE